MASGLYGARGHGQVAIEIDGIRNAADMPELGKNATALGVHAGGNQLPAFNLLFRPQARRIRVAHTLRRHGGSLGQNQPRISALGIIFGIQTIGHPTRCSTGAREGRHDNAVWQGDIADGEWGKQIGHAGVPAFDVIFLVTDNRIWVVEWVRQGRSWKLLTTFVGDNINPT